MKAAIIHGPGDVRLDIVEKPRPGPDDVVVKIAACGICGSDLTYVKFGGVTGPIGPMPLGHELAGRVEAVGANVPALAPGMRVIVNPYINQIGNGGPEGGFADYLLVRDVATEPASVLPIPDTVSLEHAALAEPLAVALHTVNRAEPEPGHRVAVFGAGPIGLGVVIGLKRRGVDDIVAIDYSPLRLERARQLGARATINPGDVDPQQALASLHGNSRHFGRQVVNTDTFIDVAGAPKVIPSIIHMCRLAARLVVTAVYSAPVPIDFRMVLAKELTIAAALGYPDEFPEIVDMLARNAVDVDPMISHRFDFSEFPKAFETARDAGASAKVMVTFG